MPAQGTTGGSAAGTAVSILEVKSLSVSYNGTHAVDCVDLEIIPGEIFGLLGPNGAGKPSTLSAIEGLVRPQSGSITVDGINVHAHPSIARSRMGVQLQSTSFQAELTISQIIRLYAGLYGVTLQNSSLAGLLRDIHLENEASRRFDQLSGGQQQRVSLLLATIHNPPLVLLDEPTAGLDPQARRQLWDRIEGIRERGHSILLTTHSMEEAQAVCDRVAIMDHGRILAIDTPAELIRKNKDDSRVLKAAHGEVTLEDVFIGLTGSDLRD